ncbi:MAG TPA: carboxypeptidase-like regulatory domain-containing protein [Pyrinomonadaceae bacterium]|nr:carboxypeptidase-like regulatory domain-containing protein [Pyrinomonadaceae bacterium]
MFTNLFKHKLIQLAVCLACVLAWSCGVEAQDDESKTLAPRTGSLSGRVVNENGEPLAQATIYVMARSLPQPRLTATDERGSFEITGLDASVFNLNVSMPGYVTPPRSPDGQPPYYRIGDSVTLSMIKGGVITGRVTSATGEPLVEAGVRAILIRDADDKAPAGPRFPIERSTDDRGVYRIYGLSPGTYLVSAGGRAYGYSANAYDGDSPTYAPSSTREVAAEVTVHAGEEITGVDIRHRGEPGHTVSGIVSGPSAPNTGPNITLTPIVNGAPQSGVSAFQSSNTKGFAFFGVADGVYDLIAQSYLGVGETAASEPLRVTVKGGDLTGINLVVKGLAAIRGHLAFEDSVAPACKNKRKPLLAETLLNVRRSDKATTKPELSFPNFFAQAAPDQSGDFLLRNLGPGQFNLNVRFFAKYWYLRSIARDVAGATLPRNGAASRKIDVARTGIHLKFGERVSGLTVILAEGAASLRGAVKLAEGESLPAKLFMNLVPAEKENAEDVLRFFTVPVNSDGTFAVNNLPPGRYWTLARIAGDDERQSDFNLRAPEGSDQRAQIRLAAEAARNSLEFKPCENVTNYELLFKTQAPKN